MPGGLEWSEVQLEHASVAKVCHLNKKSMEINMPTEVSQEAWTYLGTLEKKRRKKKNPGMKETFLCTYTSIPRYMDLTVRTMWDRRNRTVGKILTLHVPNPAPFLELHTLSQAPPSMIHEHRARSSL